MSGDGRSLFERFSGIGEAKKSDESKESKESGKKPGKDQFVIIILIGILFIIIALPTSEKKMEKSVITDSSSDTMVSDKTSIEVPAEETAGNEDETAQYIRNIEVKLENALTVIDGAGKVKVIVTARSSGEKVVEKDVPEIRNETSEQDAEGGSRTLTESELQEETVFRSGNTGISEPFVIKTMQPVIEGVVVIVQGGGNEEVRNNITEAIMALFDVEPHKITVVKMKSD